MAIPTNTHTTYEAIGNREDLTDIISNISPVDTWFTGNTGSTRAEGRFHEWQNDSLAAATENKTIEGDTATTTAVVPTTRSGNYSQILRKVFQVTDTQNAVRTAGRQSESDYQLQKNLKELARDIEYALIINASSASGASGTARRMTGAIGFISTNNTTGTGTGTQALTETMLNDNLQAVWAAGGFPSNVLCGSFQKRTISGFSTNTRNISADSKQVTAAIDVYESDFGTIAVRLHHQINTTAPSTLLVLGDMSHWVKAWLRPVRSEQLARVSSSEQFMIEAELTLEGRAETGHGKITQLTTA